MKKIPVTLCLFLLPLWLLAQQKFDYPIKPGTDNWKVMKSHKERVEASQIPAAVAKQLSTPALLEAVLDYPLSMDLFFFNTLQDGMDMLKTNFAALPELLSRKDLMTVSVERYAQLRMDSVTSLEGKYDRAIFSFKVSFLEMILAQPEVTNKLDAGRRKVVLEALVSKYEQKERLKEFYGEMNLGSSAWAAYRISKRSDDSALNKGAFISPAASKSVILQTRKQID
ncbi:hypothetical protein GFS24_06110 [Chitinophaga sp. SYP-B3965]|uniref:hypothetical protein n=1 Tax=Chitinophaga sp. SYP-B3965 TaxID=2663120 RepID=UPI001299EF5A|nr:hypothetical protein [Chitinophaga sp. SYP-B3965]MRG44678.1 hypothetical protein [Chitinophaga sp. SYP-B3965]